MTVSRPKALLFASMVWVIGVALHAYYYVTSILASPEPYDAYA